MQAQEGLTLINRSAFMKYQPALILLVVALSLFSVLTIPHLDERDSLLIRSLPLLALWFIALSFLRGFGQSLICLGLLFFTSGAFFRILLQDGALLAWASVIFMGAFCYSVCFYRYAQWRISNIVLFIPIIIIFFFSQAWVTPKYNVLVPAMWALALAQANTVFAAAMHQKPSLLIYLGSLCGLIVLALFGLANNGSLPSDSIALVILPFYLSQGLIVFGYIHFQHAYYKESE